MKYAVLYNPLSGNSTAKSTVTNLKNIIADAELAYYDMTEESRDNYKNFFNSLDEGVAVLIVGGDGTLNRFVNDAAGKYEGKEIFYIASGSGNDFWTDLGKKKGDGPVNITEYLKDLPEVTVNEKTYKFINGVGFGIDGYCCEKGDIQRAIPGKKVNYTAIAIKGLLFGYKCPNATVVVDGVEKSYKKVWLAPTMNGRFYGGGMMCAPKQDRLNKDKKVSLVVWHKSGKIATLMAFSSIFKGEHVKHTKYIEILEGNEITVKFDKPTSLQIDGETFLNITEYTVKTK